jgi:hypothetical protein
MRFFLGGKSIVPAVSLALIVVIAAVPVCQAQSPTNLSKHARRVQRRLGKYPAGSYLDVVLRDSSEVMGTLGVLSAASFTITNTDTNTTETHTYGEVAHVGRAKQYIGAGSEPEHHIRHLVPILIGAAAAGAAAAVVLSRE